MLRKKERGSCRNRWQELKEQGEMYSGREQLLVCGLTGLFTLAAGAAMGLLAPYKILTVVLGELWAPGIYYRYRKAAYEEKRFGDVNAYLIQMTQSFAAQGKVLQALRETRETFPRGTMRQLLNNAIAQVERACDVELAQQEALEDINRNYDCERVRVLHDFMCKAQLRGGDCQEEFRLLERIRQLWEQNCTSYRRNKKAMRDMVSLEYIILMGVCAFILRQFPGDLQILGLPLVQCLNVFLILCFFPVFSHMDNHLCTSMLEGDRKGRRGPAPWKKSSRLPRGKLYELWRYRTRRGEIIRRFPAWLFDLLLLLQKDSVPVALAKSAGSAPEVLREPVEELIGKLKEDPQSPEGYLSFLAEYRIPEMEGIMRRLYALSMGSGVRREVMELLIENNLNMLAQTEEQKLRLRGDLLSVSYMIPTVPVMVCMMGYGIALMYLIFQNIMAII